MQMEAPNYLGELKILISLVQKRHFGVCVCVLLKKVILSKHMMENLLPVTPWCP